MDKIEYVRTHLADKSLHKEITFKTEVSISTIRNILNGKGVPRPTTINTLHAYFKRREK